MKHLFTFVIAIAAVGCDQTHDDHVVSDYGMSSWANGEDDTGRAADTTGRNGRHRGMHTVTPGDQGGGGDMAITQLVRQRVVDEYGATTAAGNVKIVTRDRVVTLRGPVDSEGAQNRIAAIARGVENVERVDNQLELISK